MNWTKPYYGVQHLDGLKRGFRITVNDLGSCATAYIVVPGGGFTSADEATLSNISKARSWGEDAARRFNALEALR